MAANMANQGKARGKSARKVAIVLAISRGIWQKSSSNQKSKILIPRS
jgi:hypothetical protein